MKQKLLKFYSKALFAIFFILSSRWWEEAAICEFRMNLIGFKAEWPSEVSEDGKILQSLKLALSKLPRRGVFDNEGEDTGDNELITIVEWLLILFDGFGIRFFTNCLLLTSP